MSILPAISLQVCFTLDDNTVLSDLMSLKLHNYEDEVRNIVDKSVKEMSMEKVLNGINEAWLDMNFEHEKHPRTGITMLRASEQLIETLEENQVSIFYCININHLKSHLFLSHTSSLSVNKSTVLC